MKKKYRIKSNREFGNIISQKHCITGKCFIVYFDSKKLDNSRVGISVSKKLGNSPERNKIKRQVRMMMIENYDFKSSLVDLIIIVRSGYLENSYHDNQIELEKMIKKAIIKQYN